MFKIGDKVQWTSQSGGSSKTKIGMVVKIIKNGSRPSPDEIRYPGRARYHDSYLVSVKTGKTEKAKEKLYWPIVSKLQSV